jgi:peptidoglycan/xylan/chitin deacetylase (PgdA/CDA1 family)
MWFARRLGYRTIYWSIDPRDLDPATTQQDILTRVFTSVNLKPGAIILLYAGGPNTPAALGSLIAGLQQRGYAIVPLSALM